ncbi:MAG: ABC transporter ATP-binding protein [Actinomycetota bacterium]
MTAVIEVSELRKEYRRLRGPPALAVDRLDLSVPAGGVFGFLGPNGAGKTTTIRCLLGLVRPTAGRCSVLGADATRDLASVMGRIGSIVETPALYPRFSGRRNLRLLGRLHGIGPKAIDTILGRVGLAERADHLVRTYSLGMKQRLGIGAALLKDPEILILDEPANGLDPAGIKEVRELIRSLGAEGRTVFVSSHQLAEVQQIADRVAILSRGRSVVAGSVKDVLARSAPRGLVVRLDDLQAGLDALTKARIEARLDGDALVVAVPPEDAARVTQTLARKKLFLTELRPQEISLETVFLKLTEPPR